MAFTYLIVNISYMLLVLLFTGTVYTKNKKLTLLVLLVLTLLTTIFDSAIVHFNIVGYVPSKITGIYIGKAPVEDFFYPLLAVLIIPTIWKRIGGKQHA